MCFVSNVQSVIRTNDLGEKEQLEEDPTPPCRKWMDGHRKKSPTVPVAWHLLKYTQEQCCSYSGTLAVPEQQQKASSQALSASCTIPTFGFSHCVEQRAEIGHHCCCWLACLALLGRCANILQFQPWKLLWASREAVFCFVWLQQVAWITPFCRLHSSAPQGTEAGLGHCDFTRLSYSPSLCFWVCCHKQTDTIHLSLVNTPTKSLAANSDHSFSPLPYTILSNSFTNSRSNGCDIMSGCWG